MSTAAKQVAKKKRNRLPVEALMGPIKAAAEGAAAEAPQVNYITAMEDVHKLPNQRFLVLSYVCPDGITRVRSPKNLLFKFSGTLPDLPSAKLHAEAIRNEDPRFDVEVVDLYKWGQVPMPNEEKSFVPRHYADEMLSKIVSGLQNSMMQGKKEMDERKAKDRAKAEAAMQRAKGKDYKMPEKSEVYKRYEEEQRKLREEEERQAEKEMRARRITHTEDVIADVSMRFFVENAGKVIDAGTGAAFMRYFVDKTIDIKARLQQAEDREKPGEDPATLAKKVEEEEAKKKMEESQAPQQQAQ